MIVKTSLVMTPWLFGAKLKYAPTQQNITSAGKLCDIKGNVSRTQGSQK